MSTDFISMVRHRWRPLHAACGALALAVGLSAWVIADSATPDVKRSMQFSHHRDHLFTETGPFHWIPEQARFSAGEKRSRCLGKGC